LNVIHKYAIIEKWNCISENNGKICLYAFEMSSRIFIYGVKTQFSDLKIREIINEMFSNFNYIEKLFW